MAASSALSANVELFVARQIVRKRPIFDPEIFLGGDDWRFPLPKIRWQSKGRTRVRSMRAQCRTINQDE
jgi:hypothetical protein